MLEMGADIWAGKGRSSETVVLVLLLVILFDSTTHRRIEQDHDYDDENDGQLPFVQRHVWPLGRPGVVRARANDLAVRALLDDVRGPARRARKHE